MEDGDFENQQKVNEEGLPIAPGEEVKETIPEEILQDMKNLWSVFSLESQDKVYIKDLRVILRALDVDLNPSELEVCKKKIDPEGTGFILFPNLKLLMEEKLKDVDTKDDLIAQFNKLCPGNDGEIPVPKFKQFMLNLGNGMQPDEIDAMIKEAGGDATGVIEIDSFCDRLCP